MVEAWFIELAKGAGKLFLNPLLYWAIILILFSGIRRIKRERNNFGTKVFGLFAEWKHTWLVSLFSGLIVSIVCLAGGMVFSYETIFLVSVVSIIISIALRFTYLSPSYTIGFTFLLLLFIPALRAQEFDVNLNAELFSTTNFSGLAVLLGVLLIVESVMVKRVQQNDSFPELEMGKRGKWVGQHRLKKASIIPFFVLVPSGAITSFVSYWPSISLGGDTYSLLLVPFLLGFEHVIKGSTPNQTKKKLAVSIGTLGAVVLILALVSVLFPWVSLATVIIAIFGSEFIRYKHRVHDNASIPYFNREGKGLKVLAVIPGTPAARLDVLAGETIQKVNGKRVNQLADFYQALQTSGAYFKMEVIDESGEIRFVQSAFYQGDHHELGILFTKEKYRQKSKTHGRMNQEA
ncbi:PDZ domain-containing protein [Lentibacillus songyuanensis]|uniref:PDZ domain-containing protein n=1 Tax=Lentibacillus songyuanensis TaxID=3136161 RepID=UPI0031BB6181